MAIVELKQLLKDLGLSENEASIYLASLSIGPSPVMQLARSASIKRTTAYSVLESLIDQGLMGIEMRGVKKRYVAESPVRLEAMLENRRQRLRDSLGELSALFNLKSGESSIKYYEGVESLKGVYNGLLEDAEEGKDYLIISSPQEWYNLAPAFFDEFMRKRRALNLRMLYLMRDSPIARKIKKTEEVLGRQIRILPPSTTFTANLVIIPKKVVINQLVPPVWAAVIENHYIVKTFSELFYIIWNSTPKVSAKTSQ